MVRAMRALYYYFIYNVYSGEECDVRVPGVRGRAGALPARSGAQPRALCALWPRHGGVVATKVRYFGVKSTKVHTCADGHLIC